LADTLRQQSRAFRDDHGRRHLLRIVLDGHGQLGRIRNDHVCLGHARRNPVEHQLSLDRAAAGDDLRVALYILHLLSDFLVCHSQILLVLPTLQSIIENGENEQCETGPQHGA
jgi:hypothetical protein